MENTNDLCNGRNEILIVGAGITGLRLSFNLAEMGRSILLVDKAPSPGGAILQFEKQFPTNHCGLCRMLPQVERRESDQFCLRRGFVHDRIDFLPQTQLLSITGEPGDLTVVAETKPLGIDPSLCIGCGACLDACQVTTPDPFNLGLGNRKAVHPASPFSPFSSIVIDHNACTRCGDCVPVCPTEAINLDIKNERRELSGVKLVLYAPGHNPYDPGSSDLYGAGKLPNVITAAAYERLISPIGPHGGQSLERLPLRPSDSGEARKIAWVQCVGSRNIMIGADHCSSACCMFALKEAVLTREMSGHAAETKIFYMDMRTYGRDCQRYRDQAEKQFGVELARCRIHSLDQAEKPGDVLLRYVDEHGRQVAETFDLVVLARGTAPKASDLQPDWLDNPGVVKADYPEGWRIISESLIIADALTSEAGLVPGSAAPGKETTTQDQDSTDRPIPPHVLAVFILPMKQDIDWEYLEKQTPPDISLKELNSKPGDEAVQIIKTALSENKADRLLIVGGGPSVVSHSALLRKKLNLDKPLVETVDCSSILFGPWDKEDKTAALTAMIKASGKRLSARRPGRFAPVSINRTAMVIGGGPSGLSAALALALNNIDVILVEKEDELGKTRRRLLSPDLKAEVDDLVKKIKNQAGISIHLQAKPVRFSGFTGRFLVEIEDAAGNRFKQRCGAVLLAPGGDKARTTAFGLGDDDNIAAVSDLNKTIGRPDFLSDENQEIVMILCAGARQEPHNYCSRTCCRAALETAVKILDQHPKASITVFYRDIMTYGPHETLYTEARRRGVYFIPYNPESPPVVATVGERLTVRGFDPLMQEEVELFPSRIGLAVGVAPDNTDIASTFDLSLTRDGFLQEADVKWRPNDSPRQGVYICGLGRAPADLMEAMREGQAAAGRAMRLLSRPEIRVPYNTASINSGLCVGCLLCLPVCPYNARFIDAEGGPIVVDPLACRGCGLCVGACPSDAVSLGDFEEEALSAPAPAPSL